MKVTVEGTAQEIAELLRLVQQFKAGAQLPPAHKIEYAESPVPTMTAEEKKQAILYVQERIRELFDCPFEVDSQTAWRILEPFQFQPALFWMNLRQTTTPEDRRSVQTAGWVVQWARRLKQKGEIAPLPISP